MKYRFLPLAIALAATLWSCSGTKEPSALIAQADRLNGELGALAQESPMFLDSVRVDYADATLGIKIAFADPEVDADDFSDALVQFTLSEYMKSHFGANLDEIVNTLTQEKGKMSITLLDREGDAKTFDVPAARLRQLIKLKAMELNYTAARDNLVDIMAKRCDKFAEEVNAEKAEFEINSSFAQYTVTFKTAAPFYKLTQPQLTGRYVEKLNAIYNDYGACRPMVEDLVKSFKIDGYRFVYDDEKDNYTLKASIPWKLLK